jgi:hypothetical protein
VKAGASRLRAALGLLDGDQRFAASAAAVLLGTMFLPWYEKSVVIPGSKTFATDTISAFGAVSFVEAAIFLVAAGVLLLVLTRAEGGRYHLPGGDGTVIFAAGLWASLLIFYRVFDRPDVSGEGGTVGIQWGFFVAFVAAGALAFAGQRMRAAGRPEPPRRTPRPGRPHLPSADDWSDDATEVVASSRAASDAATASSAGTAIVPPSRPWPADVPASEDVTEVVRAPDVQSDEPAAGPGSGDPSDARTEISPARPRAPRDRAVRREDAEQLRLDDPPDAPPLPGRQPRTRDPR